MEETYKTKVYCTNCDFQGETDIPKGNLVSNQPCSKCGTKSLRKMNIVKARPPRTERYI